MLINNNIKLTDMKTKIVRGLEVIYKPSSDEKTWKKAVVHSYNQFNGEICIKIENNKVETHISKCKAL